jgi:hypothetical protein
MEKEDRNSALHRKEILDQEYAEIQDKLKVIAETLSEFSHHLSYKPGHIIMAEVSPVKTKYQENEIYFNKHQLKQAFNLELIDDYIMALQQKDRELEAVSKALND